MTAASGASRPCSRFANVVFPDPLPPVTATTRGRGVFECGAVMLKALLELFKARAELRFVLLNDLDNGHDQTRFRWMAAMRSLLHGKKNGPETCGAGRLSRARKLLFCSGRARAGELLHEPVLHTDELDELEVLVGFLQVGASSV